MSKKIILKGYYGWGNLGDDLLFLVIWRWTRRLFPHAEILVCTESKHPNYLSVLVDEPVTTIRNHEPVTADIIIHGGGGIYFDFKNGPAWRVVLNWLARGMGASNWRSLYTLLRKGKRIAATKRLGMGIGFGNYTLSSVRYAADLAELSSFDQLIVRDPISAIKVRNMTPGVPVSVATDLVFLTDLWLPQVSRKSNGRVIGFILRDWPIDNHAHLNSMKVLADLLMKSGYEVRCYCLDARDDVTYISGFKEFKTNIWQPGELNLVSFLSDLTACSMVVTSRAHGAIVSACLGIPSICLEIEPKLASVANMLSESATLVNPPYLAEQMAQLISERMSRLGDLQSFARADVQRNCQMMESALKKAEELLIGA